MNANRHSRRDTADLPRKLWLAGLGLSAVARRETREALSRGGARAEAVLGRAVGLAIDTRDVARGSLLTVREAIEPRLGDARAYLRSAIAPALDRVGIVVPGTAKAGKGKRKTVRRPAAKKATAAKRAPRKSGAGGRAPRQAI